MRYEKGQIMGSGGEKRVFENSQDSNKVIAEYRRGEFKKNANQIKAQYYLGKILKMLFPKNLPDIHAAGKAEKDFLLLEKVERDSDHKLVQEISISEAQGQKPPPGLIEKRDKTFKKIKKKYSNQSPVLKAKFADAGIPIDTSHSLNFSLGSDNSLIYLDNLAPWNLDRHYRQIYWNIDTQKLERAISRLPENFREKAENLYARMAQLYEEDKKSLRTTK